MPKISALPLADALNSADQLVVVQGGVTKKASFDAFPVPGAVQVALDAKQPLDSDLTAYANAVNAAARRALIGAEVAGAAAAAQAAAIAASQPLDSDLTAYANAADAAARRALIGAETAGAAAAAQAASQPLDSDLTAYANAADAAARRALIGAEAAGAAAAAQAASQPLDSDLTAYANAVNAAARRALISAEVEGAAAAAQAASQPLDSDLTAYANAADATARRALIGAEAAGAAAAVQGNLTTHEALTSAHGATSSNTAGRIVSRSDTGTTTLSGVQLDTGATPIDSVGLIRWNNVDKTCEVVTEGGVVLQIGQEETVYVRNNSGGAIANGEAVYVTGASGQRATIAKASGNSANASKMIGLVTNDAGIANNAFGFVSINGLVRGLDTSAYTDGAELYLSPTTAGALTATRPVGSAQRIVRVGYVVHAHANQGIILVKTHYHGTPLADSIMEAEGAAAGRTALGLGSLATQSGTFSGTSSGTNTGDQTASTVPNTPSGGIAATTVQAAINELDSEKAPLASPTFTGTVSGITKSMVGLGNVDNTSDANKPVSTAQQTALNLKASLASPMLTGTPTAPTASALTNSTQLATTAYADAADLSATAALVEREGLRFDGTAGATQVFGPIGTGDLTIIGLVKISELNRNYGITGGVNALSLRVYSNGKIWVIGNGIADVGSSVSAIVANVSYFICYTRQAGVGRFYIDGVLDSTIVDTTNYLGYNEQLGAEGINVIPFVGSLSRFRFANYALTAAEIAALTRRGLVTLPEQRGGSMNSPFSGAWSNYAITTFSSSGTTNFTATTSVQGYAISPQLTMRKGQRFKVTASWTGTITGLRVYCNGVSPDGTTPVTNGVSAIIESPLNQTESIVFRMDTASSAVVAVTIIPLGTLFEQDSGQRNAGYMVGDTSGNKCDLILPASGVSIIDPAQRGTIRFTTSTNGNQQLGGSQVIIPTNARITSWVINCSAGTPNVTLGNISGGAQYRASAAVATGDNDITLLTRFTSTGNLWCNSNSTATLKHTIQWEYI